MSQALFDSVARLQALKSGRAVVTRATRDLADDPAVAFGIVPVKVVSEEVIQAMAYGVIPGDPSVVVRWNPLSRDAAAFETFAAAIDAYIATCLAAETMPRFWMPYPAALTLIEVLGHRYVRNATASDALQRMGAQCLAIADEATYAGQQVVAVASDVLIRHVATGQAPIKDHHLGSLLAWVLPVPGRDPDVVADERAFEPAAAMLSRATDLEIETLRRTAKQRGPVAAAARARIESLLEGEARAEWARLAAAREAFFGLGLPAAPTLPRLLERSRRRASYYLASSLSRPRRPAALSRVLDEHEHAEDLVRDAALRGDDVALLRARRTGRAVRATVVGITQARPGRFPCTLVLETDQPVLRVRAGTRLSRREGGVAGRVVEVDDDGGTARISLVLTVGVRSVPGIGALLDLVDSEPFDPGRSLRTAYARISAAPPTLLGGAPVPSHPRIVAEPDLAAYAEELLR